MTGFPDDDPNGFPAVPGAPRDPAGPDSPRAPHGPRADPLEALLHSPAPFLSAPPGAFERIRRKAARRRRVRAAVGGSAAVAVIAGALYVAGSLHTGGGDEVVGPPASSVRDTSPPAATAAPSTPPPRASATPSAPVTRQTPVPHRTTPGPHATETHHDTATTPTTGTASAPETTAMCTAAHLEAALGGGDAGAGNLYRYLVLTNTGTTACHLTGFPGLSLLDASGRQIGDPATREPVGYVPVVLKPGGSASDTIHTVNQQGVCLPESAQVRVYPPGSKASLTFPGQITNCDNLLAITPLAPGSNGNPL
ncbi:Protein of unknown function [Streptomyces sp. DvalAA-14]|uniref:DUF4232 domain-containing protein n=1 Tax=unclassified Streptomyces TaxID=2593676 RepID=UPI00081B1E6A|nr:MULTISPECIES: DUF4232 domain-containing protein [unclassified Streptomyces]MYS19579.1 DUF4232 domain-containing protein [Streptomyces sp. SID4948]SCD47953.1 Protein of unknown function [Streptomyces sp. DvalAA-14]